MPEGDPSTACIRIQVARLRLWERKRQAQLSDERDSLDAGISHGYPPPLKDLRTAAEWVRSDRSVFTGSSSDAMRLTWWAGPRLWRLKVSHHSYHLLLYCAGHSGSGLELGHCWGMLTYLDCAGRMSQTTRKLFLNTARTQPARISFFFIEFTTATWKLEEEITRPEPDRKIGTGSPPLWGGSWAICIVEAQGPFACCPSTLRTTYAQVCSRLSQAEARAGRTQSGGNACG